MRKKEKNSKKWPKLLAAVLLTPLMTGCGGGAALLGLGSLFGGLGAGGGIGGAGLLPGAGAGIASIHNPEPASMLLVGGGIATMAYFKNKIKVR